jgi:hypothetical protein
MKMATRMCQHLHNPPVTVTTNQSRWGMMLAVKTSTLRRLPVLTTGVSESD